MKLILSLTLLLCSVYSQAAELTTPHTFTAGTPALASQVNANFQAHANAINTKMPSTIVKVNGQKIGWVYSRINGSDMVVLSDKGSMAYLYTNGEIPAAPEMHNMRAFYESADCTGQPYISTGGVTWEYGAFQQTQHLIFWDSVLLTAYYTALPAQTITANSVMYSLQAGCFGTAFGSITAYRALPNDPAITGFTFVTNGPSLMLQNLSFEIQ